MHNRKPSPRVVQSVLQQILDKLVSGPKSQDKLQEASTTKRVLASESSESKHDEQLLSKLTEQVEPGQYKPVSPNEKIKTEPIEPKIPEQEDNKGILDQLTGHSRPDDIDDMTSRHKKDKNQTDNHNGDSSDA